MRVPNNMIPVFNKCSPYLWLGLCLFLTASSLTAQDLDPRAYVHFPINANTVVTGFSFMSGSVVTDPSLPVQNIKAKVQAPSLGYARSFSLFGLTAQALVALPYTWAQVSGEVGGQDSSTRRSGLADMRLRLSVLFVGAPALTLEELMKAPRKTILGFSINVVAPTGQFYPYKLINLGTNRWAFRPELALSQPIGNRWLVDVYSGIWFFTNNNDFYPGSSKRTQEPMVSFQGHISYTIRPFMWVALNTTYYVGGKTSVNDLYKDDRQSNARIGVTGSMPLSKRSTIKLSVSTGAIVRSGQDFTAYSFGYQYSWIKRKPKPAVPTTE